MVTESSAKKNSSENWHCVAKLEQLDADFPTSLELDGQAVGLYLQDGQPYALEDVCPHAYAILSQGFVESGKIECPLHSASFDIKTGKCLNEIGQRDLKSFPLEVREGMVWIKVHAV